MTLFYNCFEAIIWNTKLWRIFFFNFFFIVYAISVTYTQHERRKKQCIFLKEQQQQRCIHFCFTIVYIAHHSCQWQNWLNNSWFFSMMWKSHCFSLLDEKKIRSSFAKPNYYSVSFLFFISFCFICCRALMVKWMSVLCLHICVYILTLQEILFGLLHKYFLFFCLTHIHKIHESFFSFSFFF